MIEGYKASDAWVVMKSSSSHIMVSFVSRQGILLLNAYAAFVLRLPYSMKSS